MRGFQLLHFVWKRKESYICYRVCVFLRFVSHFRYIKWRGRHYFPYIFGYFFAMWISIWRDRCIRSWCLTMQCLGCNFMLHVSWSCLEFPLLSFWYPSSWSTVDIKNYAQDLLWFAVVKCSWFGAKPSELFHHHTIYIVAVTQRVYKNICIHKDA